MESKILPSLKGNPNKNKIHVNQNDYQLLKFSKIANTDIDKVMELGYHFLMRLSITNRAEEINILNEQRLRERTP